MQGSTIGSFAETDRLFVRTAGRKENNSDEREMIMCKYLFKGRVEHSSAWVTGGFCQVWNDTFIVTNNGILWKVAPKTVCLFTGLHEFDIADPSVNGRIFEGDIVQVQSRRRPSGESYWTVKSEHDGACMVKAVVVFQHGEWKLDYNNPYNEKVGAARGKEQYDRYVDGSHSLYDFSFQSQKQEEEYRRNNCGKAWHDIRVIGNVHDHPELLKG